MHRRLLWGREVAETKTIHTLGPLQLESFINKCAIKQPKLSVSTAVDEGISFAASSTKTDFKRPSLPLSSSPVPSVDGGSKQLL